MNLLIHWPFEPLLTQILNLSEEEENMKRQKIQRKFLL